MSDPDYDFLQEPAPDEPMDTVETPEATPDPEPTVDPPATPAPEVTTTPEPREEMVPLAALRAEREKRQRIAQELAQYQQQNQFNPEAFYQDPRNIQTYVQQQLLNERINLSRSMVATLNPDYAEMEDLFVEEATKNPALRDEMLQAENPALFAYQTAKTLRTLREAQSGDLEKRLRAEIEAKVRAELEAKQPPSVPPDLSAVRSAKGSDAPPDDTLESILASRKR